MESVGARVTQNYSESTTPLSNTEANEDATSSQDFSTPSGGHVDTLSVPVMPSGLTPGTEEWQAAMNQWCSDVRTSMRPSLKNKVDSVGTGSSRLNGKTHPRSPQILPQKNLEQLQVSGATVGGKPSPAPKE